MNDTGLRDTDKNGKLSLKDNLTYGVGSADDSLVYSLTGSFLMFFLTTVAGVDPGAAGVITAIGAVWNALYNPVMGSFADRFGSRYGKRRPLIFAFSIPLLISVFLLFTNVSFPPFFKTVYYGAMVILFWSSYTGVFLPYLALGADYSEDYDQRTVLRLYASLFNNIGSVTAVACTNLLVSFMEQRGLSTDSAWSVTGGILGLVTFITFFITFATSKEKDPPCEPAGKKPEGAGLFAAVGDYLSVLKLRPVKHLIVASVASLICYSMLIACAVYFFTFNMGFSPAKTSLLLTCRVLIAFLLLPVSGHLAMKYDKHRALLILSLIGAGLTIAIRFTGVGNPVLLGLFVVAMSLCANSYWQLMPAIYYDVCEYDLYATGKKRQATVLSLQGLVESTATGLGSLMLGSVLKFAGFDGSAAVQNGTALTWIFNCTTWIPAVFLILTAAALWHYPLTKARYEEIRRELVRRRINEEGPGGEL
ncbi:MAG: MFS transporter [Firmicutes bacterium]|nr:MFS transporter [Bacillota bacterium]